MLIWGKMMTNSIDEIIELTTIEQWKKAFPIIKQLHSDLVEDTYLELLSEMYKDGYHLFALFVEDQIVALAGIILRVNFCSKRHLYISELVTDSSHRSLGYGEKLLDYVHHWAIDNGAEYVALESGLQRIRAHRFYEEKCKYDKWCFSFRKKL